MEEPSITEDEWISKARVFAQNFTVIYSGEDVTPYLHIFVYHLGYFLSVLGCVEKFANYATEGRHRYNKRLIITSTNGFSRRDSIYSVTWQELKKSWRQDKRHIEHPEDEPKKRKRKRQSGWQDYTLTASKNPPPFDPVSIGTDAESDAEDLFVDINIDSEMEYEVSLYDKRKVSIVSFAQLIANRKN